MSLWVRSPDKAIWSFSISWSRTPKGWFSLVESASCLVKSLSVGLPFVRITSKHNPKYFSTSHGPKWQGKFYFHTPCLTGAPRLRRQRFMLIEGGIQRVGLLIHDA